MISNQTLYAGASWDWTDSFSSYPASEYDCVLYLKKGIGSPVTITPTKDDDDFIFSRTADQTELLDNGDYQYQYKFTNISTSKVSIESGYINIQALLNSSQDQRNDDQKVLDELIAARLRIAGRDYVEVSINGKSTRFKSLEEIESAIIRYKKKLGFYKTPQIINSFV